MSKCYDCDKEMTTAETCDFPLVKIDGKWYERLSECYSDVGERCGDCGVVHTGTETHHFGCDNERCPVCHGQFAFCECKKECLASRDKKKIIRFEE